MKYLHNGVWFFYIKTLPLSMYNDLYGIGPLRIIVNHKSRRVIRKFIIEENPEAVEIKK